MQEPLRETSFPCCPSFEAEDLRGGGWNNVRFGRRYMLGLWIHRRPCILMMRLQLLAKACTGNGARYWRQKNLVRDLRKCYETDTDTHLDADKFHPGRPPSASVVMKPVADNEKKPCLYGAKA